MSELLHFGRSQALCLDSLFLVAAAPAFDFLAKDV